MDAQIDIRSWKVFRSLDSALLANIRMAMVVGEGEAGIIVMRNEDVYSIGSGELLGVKGVSEAQLPIKVAEISGTRIKGIYTGVESVVVLTENGHLFTWGKNEEGQLGLGQDSASTPVPTCLLLPNDELVVEVACGGWHTIALTDSGKVYSWGCNSDGQVSKLLPGKVWTPVEALNEDEHGRSKIMSIACGERFSLALRSNGQVWAWGKNFLIGLGSAVIEPTMVPLDFQVGKIVCGERNVLVLDKDGRLHFWGMQGTKKILREPTTVASAGLDQVLDIAASWHSSLNVCRTKCGVYFWGEWLGQDWECPSVGHFLDMDLLFAVENGKRNDSVMYRPLLLPDREETLSRGSSEEFNAPASADVNFKMRDGRVIHAHRRVLTLGSTYFNKRFNEDWREMSSGVTQIPVEDVDPDSFSSFLHYLYTGRLDKPMLQDGPGWYKKTLELMRMCHKYDQMDLFTECKVMLMPAVDVGNACEIFQVANEYKIKDLEDRTLEVMAAPNFYKIVQMGVPPDLIESIAKKLYEMISVEESSPNGPQLPVASSA